MKIFENALRVMQCRVNLGRQSP